MSLNGTTSSEEGFSSVLWMLETMKESYVNEVGKPQLDAFVRYLEENNLELFLQIQGIPEEEFVTSFEENKRKFALDLYRKIQERNKVNWLTRRQFCVSGGGALLWLQLTGGSSLQQLLIKNAGEVTRIIPFSLTGILKNGSTQAGGSFGISLQGPYAQKMAAKFSDRILNKVGLEGLNEMMRKGTLEDWLIEECESELNIFLAQIEEKGKQLELLINKMPPEVQMALRQNPECIENPRKGLKKVADRVNAQQEQIFNRRISAWHLYERDYHGRAILDALLEAEKAKNLEEYIDRMKETFSQTKMKTLETYQIAAESLEKFLAE